MTELNKEELLTLIHIHSTLSDIYDTFTGPHTQDTTWYQLKRIADSLEEIARILK